MKILTTVLTSILLTSPLLAAEMLARNPAMSEPDRFSWELFAQVAAPGTLGGRTMLAFETWASNEDTFNATPRFPSRIPSPKVLRFPALRGLPPQETDGWRNVPPGGEEVRRNRPAFQYIVAPENQFHTRAGLARAFAQGRQIDFPIDAIEVKANWIPAEGVDTTRYYVNRASDGRLYALVSLHITTKLIPNWTWATFEHADNAGRCDHVGCHDAFGAKIPSVPPNAQLDAPYPPCAKTTALRAIFERAKLAPELQNYCLKGTQTDYVSATGVPTLLGNSVTEYGFANTSSCITCHARASVDGSGRAAQGLGFVLPPDRNGTLCPTEGRCSPNGVPNPEWFWDRPGQPGQALKALQTDFLFSLPLHALP